MKKPKFVVFSLKQIKQKLLYLYIFNAIKNSWKIIYSNKFRINFNK